MILPSKHMKPERCLLAVGSEILAQVERPRAVSEVWDAVQRDRTARGVRPTLAYDWFIMALTFLYSISALRLEDGLLIRERRP